MPKSCPPAAVSRALPKLAKATFTRLRDQVRQVTGISLNDEKLSLVTTRLQRRLTALGLDSFEDYAEYVDHDSSKRELGHMVDVLTTNKTSFFREQPHFDFLKNQVFPKLKARPLRLRFWSAGCSTGEEPISLAILLQEAIIGVAHLDARILATDISSHVLEHARRGVYEAQAAAGLDARLLRRYFTCDREAAALRYRIKPSTAAMIRWAKLNLIDPWPMQGPFDAILCRNVLIYFERATQVELARRFAEALRPGGYLFVGHSESLTAAASGLRYVQPAVYVKE